MDHIRVVCKTCNFERNIVEFTKFNTAKLADKDVVDEVLNHFAIIPKHMILLENIRED